MQNLGIVIGILGILLAGVALGRGLSRKTLRQFPLFYSYIVFVFFGSIISYGVYWFDQPVYPSFYWLYFLISILVEFSVLTEISDHVFKSLPALRSLGRFITIAVSALLAGLYIFPVILHAPERPPALLGFALRASITKLVVLTVLFLVARHYDSFIEKPVAGLMLGFAIYLGVNVANLAAALTFQRPLYQRFLWIISPIAFTLCLIVWIRSLWNCVPQNNEFAQPMRSSQPVALQLTQFNDELTKFLEK